jgi:hypothetical protein
LKFLVTVITFIPLNTSSFTYFFGVIFLTIWTSFSVFLQSFVNKPFLTPILPYFQALFRPPFFSLSLIHLLNTNNSSILWSNGTAVGSATIETQDSVVVPGEGVWTVSGGTVVFTAEESYTGIPTPIYYVVEDDQGNQTNAAQVAIISNCVCDTYEKSVSAMNLWSMLLTILFISTIGVLLARREFN